MSDPGPVLRVAKAVRSSAVIGCVELTSQMIVDRADQGSTGAFQMTVRAGKRTSQRRLAAGGIESRARLVEVLAAASLVTGAASLGTPTL